MKIQSKLYQTYLASLLGGNRGNCLGIVNTLLEDKIEVRDLYVGLFQKSMYRVGELWETNKISVAREHLATTITESLLSSTYPYLFSENDCGKKAIISCAVNEYHQLGGKMVADIFELHGWHGHFLGANTPINDLVGFVDDIKPDVIGLSLAIHENLPLLIQTLEAIKANFGQIDIIVGGQAFTCGGIGALKKYSGTLYIESLADLESIF